MGGGGGKKLQATIIQGNLEEEYEPNLNQLIDNIQDEPIELMVSIVELKQPIVVTVDPSQPIQHVVEFVHVENP